MIYPPTKAVVKEAKDVDLGGADFVADVQLIQKGIGNEETLDVKAIVWTEIEVWDKGKDGPRGRIGEAVFFLAVRDSSLPRVPNGRGRPPTVTTRPDWELAEGGYWTSLSVLNRTGWTTELEDWHSRNWACFIPLETRQAMLVWWDEHAAEVESRISENPGISEVEYHLTRVGLDFSRERSGTADWGIEAWGLGGDVYLVDNEDESFGLVSRSRVDDEITEIATGTLAEMLESAVNLKEER